MRRIPFIREKKMKSKMVILLTLILSIFLAGQAYSATITAYPTKVPKGAFVGGPLGTNNYYWQMITLTAGAPAHAAAATATITLPTGMYVADTDGDAGYTDEVTLVYDEVDADGMTATVTATIGTVVIAIVAQATEVGDVLRVMIPVTTDVTPSGSTGTYTVTWSDATDGITVSDGQVITYIDPGAKALQLVTFADNLSANDDTTRAIGDKYPTAAAPTYGALPDMIVDLGDGAVNSANRGTTMMFPALTGVNSNEVGYQLWVSTDSTLAHVDSLTSGVFHAIDFATMQVYTANEGGTGSISYSMGGYPEGKYYFYVTSVLTGNFPLSRSDGLVVRHWPVINNLAWDYNHSGAYITGVGGTGDDKNLFLDTGNYYKYDGTIDPNASYDYVYLYANVLDLDDNAKLTLFYSANASLDTSAVLKSGSAADTTLAITGLTGATLIKADLLENQQDETGFIKWRWNVNPDSVGAVVPAKSYTVYGILCDSKHFYMTTLKGAGASSLSASVNNSPKLLFDALTEYDTNGAAGIQVDVARQDVIMVSWGKSGINGDKDLDDSALIELYAVRDDTPATPTYDYSEAALIRAAAAATPAVVHRISNGLSEDLEAKNRSWLAWDLKKDYKETGWAPVEGGGAIYILYGIIDENKTGGTVRVVVLGPTDAISLLPDHAVSVANTAIAFTNNPYSRLFDPPAKGVTINAEQTYRMKYYSFDWDAGVASGQTAIFVVNTNTTGYTDGPATTTVATLSAAANGKAYCLTSTDGTLAAGVWLTANTDSAYYDLTISPPGTINKYVTSMNGANDLTNGSYWVYIGVDPNNNAFVDGTEVVYRAPGTLTIQNIGATAPPVKNLFVSPMEVTTAQGDTTQFTLRSASNGSSVDRIDAFIAVEKNYWNIVSPLTPFTALGTFSDQLIANQVIDDAVNNRWIMRLVAFQSGGTDFTITAGGLGDPVASFKLVSKGTAVPLEQETSIYFVNEPMNNRVTKFSHDGVDISTNNLPSTVKVVPRAIVEGIVQLEGRSANNVQFTFDLRKRGSYEPVTDTLFINTNDRDLVATGIQYIPDSDGKFTFMKVPTGQWDVVVKYDRYVSPWTLPVNVYPGVDTVFVNFGVILGGDCFGYVDSLGIVLPDNEIKAEDLNRIRTAFLATPASPKWNNGVDNWKWCDINQDNVVEVDDLAMATKNVNTTGAQPVYKKASPPDNINLNAFVQFMNVPSSLSAGQTYTIQVVAKNTAGIRAYFVNMKYDSQALTLEKIMKGEFINSDSYSFPVIGEGKVGLVNSAYGDGIFSGDGVLAEVTFTAIRDGVFTSDMLGLVEASFVNKDSMIQDVLPNSPLNAAAATPLAFTLGQNFPNPFNPTTSIGFSVPETGQVMINIYDILGRNVRTLISGQYTPGRYSVVWDAKDSNGRMVSSGTYLYRITAGKFTEARRMLFMK
jgi:hypothetical protein